MINGLLMHLADTGGSLCYEPSFWLGSNLLRLRGGKLTGRLFCSLESQAVSFYILRGRVREDEVEGRMRGGGGRTGRVTAD